MLLQRDFCTLSASVFIALFVLLCGTMAAGQSTDTVSGMTLTSSAFSDSAEIPVEYTCDCANMSPPLRWSGIPGNTKSLALVVDDPDAPAGTWVHWVCYNIPPADTGCTENIPAVQKLPNGSYQGVNDFKTFGYGGPCPPEGLHRYFFTLYALDVLLPVDSAMHRKKLMRAMRHHILDKAVLLGTYHRLY